MSQHKAYYSTIVHAAPGLVWATIRDFNALPAWHPGIERSEIEDGRAADSVGCVRSFRLKDGAHIREKLLALSDQEMSFTYDFQTSPIPADNYKATMRVTPVTKGGHSFVEWWATFDCASGGEAELIPLFRDGVFKTGLEALPARLAGQPLPLWPEGPPAKVFCSDVINAPPAAVWAVIRDFAGMGGWHEDITRMHMLDGRRSDEVGATRDFLFGDGRLHEQLTQLSDLDRSFTYRITTSPMPWVGYSAGARLHHVVEGDRTLAVWTADWHAAPHDDLTLIPTVHEQVFQKAFDTLNARHFAR
ncbi:MAG TPA: SRPBCC family protein [Acetobacteraceae bacterium]|nr:SRPBCC family protein [Acetobacteraceae bacterium]